LVDELERDLIEELKNPEFAKSYGAECAKSEFGLALFRTRQTTKLTQKELSEKLGVSQPYIAQLESGEANPTLGVAGKMLAMLGKKMVITIEPLVFEENSSIVCPFDTTRIHPAENINYRYFSVDDASSVKAIEGTGYNVSGYSTVNLYNEEVMGEPRLMKMPQKLKTFEPELVLGGGV
jgi:transcriptional regulator with XRE-family HTH domain